MAVVPHHSTRDGDGSCDSVALGMDAFSSYCVAVDRVGSAAARSITYIHCHVCMVYGSKSLIFISL